MWTTINDNILTNIKPSESINLNIVYTMKTTEYGDNYKISA
jgi:hypothetical protein